MNTNLDRVILGMNPLMGVDHLSSQRARARGLTLDDTKMVEVVKTALEFGATGVNFSPEAKSLDVLRNSVGAFARRTIGLYPIIPNTREYVGIIAERGLIGLLRSVLVDMGWVKSPKYLLQGGLALARSSPVDALALYISYVMGKLTRETSSFGEIKGLFLHELATDLMVSFNAIDLFKAYLASLKSIGITPGFVTRNYPRFCDFTEKTGTSLRDIIVMTPVNPIGFQMAPNVPVVEDALRSRSDVRVIGINILASGQVRLEEAIRYVNNFNCIQSVAVGVSTTQHARETFKKLTTDFHMV